MQMDGWMDGWINAALKDDFDLIPPMPSSLG
jgi:hypothetical protein